MSDNTLQQAQQLSDKDLLARVKLLAQRERTATVALVAHLAVLDERRLYLSEGCASLFTYCTQVLHLAEHAAYNRIEAARAARRFPLVLTSLEEGSVTLTAVRRLAPHLTDANHAELLAAARHRTKEQIEDLIVSLHPRPPVPSTIRRLPWPIHEPSPDATEATSQAAAVAHPPLEGPVLASLLPLPGTPLPRPREVEPLGLDRYHVQFTATRETRDKIRLAQDLLRHQIPNGDLGEIMDRALTLLIDAVARQKLAWTERPQNAASSASNVPTPNPGAVRPGASTHTGTPSRHIPAAVRRAVWARDGGQCAFVADGGHRCTERGFLEFHHVVPYASGGDASPDNIQLRCRAHNGYEAALCFGLGHPQAAAPGAQGHPSSPTRRLAAPASARAGPG